MKISLSLSSRLRLIPEHPIIRPPGESKSILLRITRGCNWNRCKFCGQYPHFGEPSFSTRSVDEIRMDITLSTQLYGPYQRTAFLGDADPLVIPMGELALIIKHLYSTYPNLKRVTAYARASTLYKKGLKGLEQIKRVGVNRVHVGLESGDDEILRFHGKGQTRRILVKSGLWVKKAGIELSWYVLLGLGGKVWWRKHADRTAEVINEVNPDFIRFRRLWVYEAGEQGAGPRCPLWDEIEKGKFKEQTPEGTVLELKRIIERLNNITSLISCDHNNNYVKIGGRMPRDKGDMLSKIEKFLNLPERLRLAHYQTLGSRI